MGPSNSLLSSRSVSRLASAMAPEACRAKPTRKSNAKTLLERQAIDDAENAVVDLINDSYIREREYVTAGSRVVRGTSSTENDAAPVTAIS